MNIYPYGTESNYLFWEGVQNLIYFMKFDISFCQKWHNVDHDHGGVVYALRTSSNHSYTSKKYNNTLKQ